MSRKPSAMSLSTPLRCKCRKQAVTSLRCSRCSVPICPDCSRPAPVGMLCRECASNKKSRLYQVSAGSFALASLASVGVAALGSWILTSPDFGMGSLFELLLGFALGTGVGEIALRVTGRKRGLKMEIMGGVCACAGLLIGYAINRLQHPMPNLSNLPEFAEGMPLSLMPSLFSPRMLLLIGITVFGAVNRIRLL